MINIWCQPMDSSILKNLYQVNQEKYINKKKLNINLVHHLWLDFDQGKIDQVLLLSIGYPWKQLNHKKKVFKNESIEDMKWCVKHDDSWRRINKDLVTMNRSVWFAKPDYPILTVLISLQILLNFRITCSPSLGNINGLSMSHLDIWYSATLIDGF
jgi:hypothetical protein